MERERVDRRPEASRVARAGVICKDNSGSPHFQHARRPFAPQVMQ